MSFLILTIWKQSQLNAFTGDCWKQVIELFLINFLCGSILFQDLSCSSIRYTILWHQFFPTLNINSIQNVSRHLMTFLKKWNLVKLLTMSLLKLLVIVIWVFLCSYISCSTQLHLFQIDGELPVPLKGDADRYR